LEIRDKRETTMSSPDCICIQVWPKNLHSSMNSTSHRKLWLQLQYLNMCIWEMPSS
jgi:hypothetical protein